MISNHVMEVVTALNCVVEISPSDSKPIHCIRIGWVAKHGIFGVFQFCIHVVKQAWKWAQGLGRFTIPRSRHYSVWTLNVFFVIAFLILGTMVINFITMSLSSYRYIIDHEITKWSNRMMYKRGRWSLGRSGDSVRFFQQIDHGFMFCLNGPPPILGTMFEQQSRNWYIVQMNRGAKW